MATRVLRKPATNHPWWFVAPAMALLLVFFVLPNLLNFVYPFTNWSSYHASIGFVGLDNLRAIVEDGSLISSLRVTLVYAVLVALFQNLFGLLLALLLEHDTRLNRSARVFFFLPVLIAPLAVGYIFQALLDTDGALNGVLGGVLGREVGTAWLGSTTWTIVVVSLVHAWKWMGLAMLVYLAGLKSIPGSVLEAARMDGSSPWRTFHAVRFPLLAPAVTFNVATALLGTMNGFDIVQATTGGGPARSTEVLNIFIFRTFGQGLYAQATAMSLVLFLTVVLLAIPVVRILRKREEVL
jgi:raffinose/stachyose/melibiose transport system permease protein